MHLISASRRTDIPAFYSRWFMRRIDAGSVAWANPYSGKISTLSLLPEDVADVVCWTRNFAPMGRHVAELERRGIRFIIHFTLTGLPRRYESHVPPVEAALAQIRRLAQRLGPDRVLWRYDPILIAPGTGPDFHRRSFESIASRLEGATRQCTISFVQIYGKVRASFAKRGLSLPAPDPELRRTLAHHLGEIGAARGIAVRSCCP